MVATALVGQRLHKCVRDQVSVSRGHSPPSLRNAYQDAASPTLNVLMTALGSPLNVMNCFLMMRPLFSLLRELLVYYSDGVPLPPSLVPAIGQSYVSPVPTPPSVRGDECQLHPCRLRCRQMPCVATGGNQVWTHSHQRSRPRPWWSEHTTAPFQGRCSCTSCQTATCQKARRRP